MVIGYTSGVYDLFHIGHLNLLRNAKSMCDKLIVGVTTDELMLVYKKKSTFIPFNERCEIVRSIKYVDAVVPQVDMDKLKQWEKLKFNVLFVGDDWHNTEKWQTIEGKLKDVNVQVIYFPYTKGVSSTKLNAMLVDQRSK
ncbi:adenylyltransferase/cytidyltransferase family protein [Spirochaeta isovalerica]|uniref:Glycerol-3-phosphate cytidylyltransferase n=1 Tax=Spirochaeta isovalerica TaxID=150 RepID=A0A841RBZ3_9SPIO|nr:adenylyltransferase/cytidyltransferase family protein [Spirochaeta isovalerica]MBB6480747.1 glycerol-3-phosphate cytidylyltransferase [Spirochaeta isovalerica]